MRPSDEKPILVTGSHRSGSSWVGKMLSFARGIELVREPFNRFPTIRPYGDPFPFWFHYVCPDNEADFASATDTILHHLRRPPAAHLWRWRPPVGAIHALRDLCRSAWGRARGKRTLLKDPIAVFSADWLARRFRMQVVVLVRHPAAFAGSIKHWRWPHPFGHFLEQPLLMRHHLADFRAEIEEYTATEKSLVDQASLLWNLIYHVVVKYRSEHPDWIFVRHEDLSRDPVGGFRALYDLLGLEMTGRIEAEILAFSTREPPGEGLADAGNIQRDSRSSIFTWRSRLTREEIDRVRDRTRKVAEPFYGPADWGD